MLLIFTLLVSLRLINAEQSDFGIRFLDYKETGKRRNETCDIKVTLKYSVRVESGTDVLAKINHTIINVYNDYLFTVKQCADYGSDWSKIKT